MQNYVSADLHHFVGRRLLSKPDEAFELLLRILREKSLHPGGLTDARGGITLHVNLAHDANLTNEQLLSPLCVCFADIPLDDLQVHAAKYGVFGLSFNKTFLASRNARPVSYVPIAPGNGGPLQGYHLLRDIEAAYRGVRKFDTSGSGKSRLMGQEPMSAEDTLSTATNVLETAILPFIKVFRVDLEADHASNFYMEREWRILHGLSFDAHDVTRVFVPTSHADRFRTAMPTLAGRIFSLR